MHCWCALGDEERFAARFNAVFGGRIRSDYLELANKVRAGSAPTAIPPNSQSFASIRSISMLLDSGRPPLR